MQNKHDDIPAFPIIGHTDQLTKLNYETKPGMTLRDYFAAAALQGTLAGDLTVVWGDEEPIDIGLEETQKAHAELAYDFADAMLKARGE